MAWNSYANTPDPQGPHSRDRFRGRGVLIVEDDMMVAMLLQDMVIDIGCEIAGTAHRYQEAVEKARTAALDVAIIDVNLNGRPGFEIADILAGRGIAFLFSTGYGRVVVPAQHRHVPLLQKPFERSDLERALLSLL